jgi:hypothetical protein
VAFVIAGPRTQVVIEDHDERLLHDLPRQFRLRTPQCDLLWEAFYRDPKMTSSAQVEQFRSEIQSIRASYEESRRRLLIRERKIHAKDPSVVAMLLEPLLRDDPVLAKCDEIVRLCDEAIAGGHGLTCSSD